MAMRGRFLSRTPRGGRPSAADAEGIVGPGQMAFGTGSGPKAAKLGYFP